MQTGDSSGVWHLSWMATVSLQPLLTQALGSEGGSFFLSNGNQEFKMKSASLNFYELLGMGRKFNKTFYHQ